MRWADDDESWGCLIQSCINGAIYITLALGILAVCAGLSGAALPIKDRTNFGSGWVVDKNFDTTSGDHVKWEHNTYWIRHTLSNEKRQIKYIFYEKRTL